MKKFVNLISSFCFSILLYSCNNTYSLQNIESQQKTESYSSTTKNTSNKLIEDLVNKRFIFADINKDKNLTFSEFKTLESESEDVIRKMFNFYDENQDNIVSYDEFFTIDSNNAKNGIQFLFGWLDTNENTLIDFGVELDRVIKISKKEANDNGFKLTEEEVKKDFIDSDQNKDEKLDFEEFSLVELKYIVMIPKNESKIAPSINKLLNSAKTYLGK
jgi:Ca2+-binding EF-hand superfamily protein